MFQFQRTVFLSSSQSVSMSNSVEPKSSPELSGHLFHGDIKLTPMEEMNMEKYGNPYGISEDVGRAASSNDDKRWPNAIIPYELDCSVGKNLSVFS